MQHLSLTLSEVSTKKGSFGGVSAGSKDFVGSGKGGDEAKRAGIGAATGAIGGFVVGKLFHHGGAGAVAGGAGGATVGAVTAKPGPVKLPAETVIHFHLAKSLAVAG